MSANRRRRTCIVVAEAVLALVLGISTTLSLAATGALRGAGPASWWAPGALWCAHLPGHVVEVTESDVGPGMTRGSPGGCGMGMMRLVAHPSTVPSGTISLRVFNTGPMTHEVVVLPLAPGQSIGQRPTHPDGKIDEAGSLGEVSRSCGAGSDDGILPSAAGWTTLTLHPGRDELVCNLPGHHLAGMYAELDVTSP